MLAFYESVFRRNVRQEEFNDGGRRTKVEPIESVNSEDPITDSNLMSNEQFESEGDANKGRVMENREHDRTGFSRLELLKHRQSSSGNF